MWYVWLIASAIFFIIEIATVGFLIFWLGIGALCAMVTSFFTDNVLVQTIVFVSVSAILIPLTKPLVDKYLVKKTVPTNTYTVLNKTGIVTKSINSKDDVGLVKVNGEVWSAISEGDFPLSEGTEVEVLKIDGVKIVVTPKK